ncbi:MAG: metallophosphoesterase family protein [Chloroflexota bacterium]|nr:metallophosphoesterase family protein [Chloroflexota bacterium]MBI5703379.1 metallophosphoesterase family protein [Chloroflexota bacterium]
MKLAVLSDVHGNCFALETALADMKKAGFDRIVCNGDMIQSGPQPHETVQLLREMNCSIVMGNSDAWLLSGVETDAHLISDERRKKLNLVRAWSLSKLTEEDRAFINSFPLTVSIDLGRGRSLLAFHGSPTSFDQFLLPSTSEDEFQEILKPYAESILTGGHMHLQYTRRLRDSQNFFFNPGSVGVAYNHEQSGDKGFLDPWAEYAMLTVDGMQMSLEFRRVPLDMEKMAEIYRTSDRPFADEAMSQYAM